MALTWKLRHKVTDREFVYNSRDLHRLEKLCKCLIDENIDKNYNINAYDGEKLVESVELTDYFNK